MSVRLCGLIGQSSCFQLALHSFWEQKWITWGYSSVRQLFMLASIFSKQPNLGCVLAWDLHAHLAVMSVYLGAPLPGGDGLIEKWGTHRLPGHLCFKGRQLTHCHLKWQTLGFLWLLDYLLCLSGQRGHSAKETCAGGWENLRNSGGGRKEMNDALVLIKWIDLIRK